MEKQALEMLTPVAPAFIGDAVHTLYIRRRIVESGRAAATLHLLCSRFVNAKAQAKVFDELTALNELTDEEAEIARRAKNAHLHSRAKTASPEDYHKATALEAVIGYLELSGNASRRDYILDKCAEVSGLNDFLSEK